MQDNYLDSIVKLLLDNLREYDFVLSGGYALNKLELSYRPTLDIDLFTNMLDPDRFSKAVNKVLGALDEAGYQVRLERESTLYAKISIGDSMNSIDVDFGYDYREFEPIICEVGPVLNELDAILNKVSAMYARWLPRDFIDLYYIRQSGVITDAEILDHSHE